MTEEQKSGSSIRIAAYLGQSCFNLEVNDGHQSGMDGHLWTFVRKWKWLMVFSYYFHMIFICRASRCERWLPSRVLRVYLRPFSCSLGCLGCVEDLWRVEKNLRCPVWSQESAGDLEHQTQHQSRNVAMRSNAMHKLVKRGKVWEDDGHIFLFFQLMNVDPRLMCPMCPLSLLMPPDS